MIVGRYDSSRSSSSKKNYKSNTPFMGCYDRSYYDRRGRLHPCYVSDRSYGTKSGWNIWIVITVLGFTLLLIVMVWGIASTMISVGGKVSGNAGRIFIEDKAELLTDSEEKEILEVFADVYEAYGMPVTLYTDDFSWKNQYDLLRDYSKKLYYRIGYDEDAVLILCTAESNGDFYDWHYDIYRGAEAERCFSDAALNKFDKNFSKAMTGQDLAEALEYSWSTVMDDLAKTTVDSDIIPAMLFFVPVYGLIYAAAYVNVSRDNAVYRYYKKNPDKLSNIPMTLSLYSKCPKCGAVNTLQKEVCPYCGTGLKLSVENVDYIKY